MKNAGILMIRDLQDLVRSAAFRFFGAAFLLLAVVLALGTFLLSGASFQELPAASGVPTVSAAVGMMLYFSTMLPFLVLLWIFAGAVLSREKASGRLETLLATPLQPRELWLGKTAAVFLPGLVISIISSVLLVVAAAVASGPAPAANTLEFSVPLCVVCWLGNPLLFAGLGALTVIIALRADTDIAIIPSFAVGFSLMAVILAGTAVGIVDLASWLFACVYLGIAALEWLVVLLTARNLTKERIVLTARSE